LFGTLAQDMEQRQCQHYSQPTLETKPYTTDNSNICALTTEVIRHFREADMVNNYALDAIFSTQTTQNLGERNSRNALLS